MSKSDRDSGVNLMSIFDTKWIVTFNYSNSILSLDRKDTIEIMASSDWDARSKAKAILKTKYKYFDIVDVRSFQAESNAIEEKKRELEKERKLLERERWLNSLTEEERKNALAKEEEELKTLADNYDPEEELKWFYGESRPIRSQRLKRNALLIPSIFTGMFSMGFIAILIIWITSAVSIESDPFSDYNITATMWLLIPSVTLTIGTIVLLVLGIIANNKLKKMEKMKDGRKN